ncbi:hypothetical protein WJX81_004253 [Elliptochloris bilobata]|uniref:Non-structural maintenance of chromosomes element 4 n=1 Tax=Elliptochloris bilobata TaxID=381761 RepID=A0AAW1SEL6_9CHLO
MASLPMRVSQQDSQARQDAEAKNRKLRTKYRKLRETIQYKSSDIADLTRGDLHKTLDEANALRLEVARPREGVEDSECFAVICDKGAEGARKLVSGGRGRTVRDFIRALKTTYGRGEEALADDEPLAPDAFDWGALARRAAPLFRPAPGVSCMLGPMDAAHKERKAVVRAPKRRVGEKLAPTELSAAEAAASAEIEENRTEMLSALVARGDAGAGLLETVLNHASFAQTVENIFALSFMVSAARARVARHPELGLVVHANIPRGGAGAAPAQGRQQVALSYSMEDWQHWRRVPQPKQHATGELPEGEEPGPEIDGGSALCSHALDDLDTEFDEGEADLEIVADGSATITVAAPARRVGADPAGNPECTAFPPEQGQAPVLRPLGGLRGRLDALGASSQRLRDSVSGATMGVVDTLHERLADTPLPLSHCDVCFVCFAVTAIALSQLLRHV